MLSLLGSSQRPADSQRAVVLVGLHSTPALAPGNYTRKIVALSAALATV